MGIFLGGNFSGGKCPVAIFRVVVVLVPQQSHWIYLLKMGYMGEEICIKTLKRLKDVAFHSIKDSVIIARNGENI